MEGAMVEFVVYVPTGGWNVVERAIHILAVNTADGWRINHARGHWLRKDWCQFADRVLAARSRGETRLIGFSATTQKAYYHHN